MQPATPMQTQQFQLLYLPRRPLRPPLDNLTQLPVQRTQVLKEQLEPQVRPVLVPKVPQVRLRLEQVRLLPAVELKLRVVRRKAAKQVDSRSDKVVVEGGQEV